MVAWRVEKWAVPTVVAMVALMVVSWAVHWAAHLAAPKVELSAAYWVGQRVVHWAVPMVAQ